MTTLKFGSRGDEVRTLQSKLKVYVDGIFGKLTEEAVKYFQGSHGLVIDEKAEKELNITLNNGNVGGEWDFNRPMH